MAHSRKSSSGSSSSSSSSGTHRHWWPRKKKESKHASHESNAASTCSSAAKVLLISAAQRVLPSYSNSTMTSNGQPSENSPLLQANGHEHRRNGDVENQAQERTAGESNPRVRGVVWGLLTLLFVAALMLLVGFEGVFGDALSPWLGGLPKDPTLAALAILDKAPVIDGHIDLPILVRAQYANNASAVDLQSEMPGQVDIPRLRKGKVGGFFWSVYVSCPDPALEGEDFLGGTWRVRDTLEQIDVSKLLIAKYPDTFALALTVEDIKAAIVSGKIAGLLGVEGGHQLGNSIAVLRQYHALGVRYVTLTHTCHNSFADSCGFLPGMIPLHGGLSDLGKSLIDEMNRLGVLVDLSHTSDATAKQAIAHSKAPVIWSHSSARAVHDVPRNVPDDVLRLIGRDEGKKDAVVMVNFAPFFAAPPGQATVEAVANHVDHIAKVAGKEHVGLGSDFDGIGDVPVGLEDVSKYPALVRTSQKRPSIRLINFFVLIYIAELYRRGWDKYELAGLTGGNLLRVLERAEKVSQELQTAGASPVFDLYEKRTDIPRKSLDL